MHKELEVMKPRCNGLWKRGAGTAALIYFWILTNVPVAALAKSEKGKSDATDTGVTEVTDGINVIKDLVLGCVGGVGVIFLAWGLLDFGTGYSAHDTILKGGDDGGIVGFCNRIFLRFRRLL